LIRGLGFVVLPIGRAMAKGRCAPKKEVKAKKQTKREVETKKKVKTKMGAARESHKTTWCQHPYSKLRETGSNKVCRRVKCSNCNEALLVIRRGLPFADLQNAAWFIYGFHIDRRRVDPPWRSPSDEAGPDTQTIMDGNARAAMTS